MRINHWSCTNFANWLRGTEKPKFLSLPDWKDWKIAAKKLHPFRYWLVETLLDRIQTVIYYPTDKFYSFKSWFNNRFITKTHALTSTLKRGQWHEFDERILYCLFDELVNFVEIEQAWCRIAWDEEARKKYRTPWYACGWFKTKVWRSPEAGLDYLNWAASLTYDESWVNRNDPNYGKPTQQALDAIETKELYNWWKNIRPARPDPYDESGWTDRITSIDDVFTLAVEDASIRDVHKRIDEIENYYFDEDAEMMMRLVKLRRGLWT